MSYVFKPAVREEVGLLIGLIGPSGSGKTMSAMRLASGIVGQGKRFAIIDTESRRALHYADMFQFDHLELGAPFRPKEYADSIQVADKAGYKAIVVDSFSHEWAGEGGILDWQEEELSRMVSNAKNKNPNSSEYQLRESMKMASWIKPKMGHKQMVQRLLQVKANLILCFRAEEKVKMEKDQDNKTVIVPVGFQPICSKELPYELTVSFLLDPSKPGFPVPIKLQEQHRAIFPLDKPINEESGRLVSEWARGGAKRTISELPPEPVEPSPIESFDSYMNKKCKEQGKKEEVARKKLKEYIKELSELGNVLPEEVKTGIKDHEGFWSDFLSWVKAKAETMKNDTR